MTYTPSLSERLADDIAEMIREQQLEPGQPLASARALAQRFEVTTPTIREALRRLEAASIIELRHGSGTYVGRGAGRAVMANPHRPPITRESVLELAEARLTIEPRIAALAARARSPQALARLEEAAQNALTPPVPERAPRLHFHVELAACTGNALLAHTVEALLDVRRREQVEIRFTYDDRERDHAEHREILAAVRGGRAEEAEALTQAHLRHIRDLIAESPQLSGGTS